MAQAQFRDQTLKCSDCGASFLWSAKDQRFYAEKRFTPPKRCKPCRETHREQKDARNSYEAMYPNQAGR